MGFNLKVIIQLAGIGVTICLFAYCLTNTQFYATMLTLGLVLCFQIAVLLRFITYTNRQLSRFLSAINYSDFSQSFKTDGLNSSFKDLGQSFEKLIERFRQERTNKEIQAAYLQAFVEQIPIAVLALNDSGKIDICNKAFRHLVQRQEINQLDQIKEFSKELVENIKSLQPGKEQSLQIKNDQETLSLTLSCSILRTEGRQQKLVSIQNIQSELEAKEIEAWQNLIRVMTHEIMNSITPITSLADTSGQYISEVKSIISTKNKESSKEIESLLEDVSSAITTIGSRGQGLMRFVESYRSLTKLPLPKIRQFEVRELFKSVDNLMAKQAANLQLSFSTSCSPVTLELHADPELLEQALINLVRNAFEATAGSKDATVKIKATLKDRGKVEIEVSDNGSGIEQENMENIFIPFFTTKRGGSGIGMSIVKQIVNLNNGSVKVHSTPGIRTTIVMVFN